MFPFFSRRWRRRCPPRCGDGADDLAGVPVRLRVEPLDLPRHLAHAPDAVGDGPNHVLPVAAVQVPPSPTQHRQKGALLAVTLVRGKSLLFYR